MIDRPFAYKNFSLDNLTEIHDDSDRRHRIEWKDADEEWERYDKIETIREGKKKDGR